MIWYVVRQLFSTSLEWIRISRLSEQEKALEILILRKQLAMIEQRLDKSVRLSRAERLTLAVISAKLKTVTGRSLKELCEVIRLVQPETVFKWHRELVRRKWTYRRKHVGGRPRISPCVEELVMRLARENGAWGYGKIKGELAKLGHQVSRETIPTFWNAMGFSPRLNEIARSVGVI